MFMLVLIKGLHDGTSKSRGEFNNARARRALVDWYLSLFVMCKAWHQYNERLKALALLNSPQMCMHGDVLYFRLFVFFLKKGCGISFLRDICIKSAK